VVGVTNTCINKHYLYLETYHEGEVIPFVVLERMFRLWQTSYATFNWLATIMTHRFGMVPRTAI